jgi:hypothetical protein
VHLQQIAEAFQYRVIRGPFAEFLNISYSDSLLSFLMSRTVNDGHQEIILHFLEDLFQYEYLILLRPGIEKK